MKVKHLIQKLNRENPDEEVVFILNGNRSAYYIIEGIPFLHAGPREFCNKRGEKYTQSVVLIRAKDWEPCK